MSYRTPVGYKLRWETTGFAWTVDIRLVTPSNGAYGGEWANAPISRALLQEERTRKKAP